MERTAKTGKNRAAKGILAVLIGAALACFSAGCGHRTPVTFTVTPEDGFDNSGWVEVEAPETGNYRFSGNEAANDSEVLWKVVVTDRKYDGAAEGSFGGLFKNTKGTAMGSAGELDGVVKKGDYIYIYCSENNMTLPSLNEATNGAELLVTGC